MAKSASKQTQINTSNFGSDIAWELIDSSGIVIANGGCQTFPGNCYSSNTTYDNWLCVPDGCYSIALYDMFGDGWGLGTYNLVGFDGTTYSSGTLSNGSYSLITNEELDKCEDDKPIKYTVLTMNKDGYAVWKPNANHGFASVGHIFSKDYPSRHVIRLPSKEHVLPSNLKDKLVEEAPYKLIELFRSEKIDKEKYLILT